MKRGQQVQIGIAPHVYAEFVAGGGPLEHDGEPVTFVYIVDRVSICRLDYGTRYGKTALLPTSWLTSVSS